MLQVHRTQEGSIDASTADLSRQVGERSFGGFARDHRRCDINCLVRRLPERGSSRPSCAARPALPNASRTIPKHKSP